MKTKVKFIIFEGDIIALFPDIIADKNNNILSYQHLGQHGAASKTLLRRKKAKINDYINLMKELELIGYDLEVI